MVLNRPWVQRRLLFYQFLTISRDNIKTLFCECETSKRFDFEVCQVKHFRKWFSNYIEVKSECSEPLKIAFLFFFFFFFFFAILWVPKLKWFSEKVKESLQDFKSKVVHWKHLRKWFWGQKWIFWAFRNDIFHLLANFWVSNLKLFLGKARQSV